MPQQKTLIPVGKIIDTHGVKGLLKLHTYSGNLESLSKAGSVVLTSTSGIPQTFNLASVKPHGKGFLISLKGMDDINLVEALVGSELCLSREQLPETAEDEYYWCDLIGLSVATTDGRELGTISDIFETGSSDIYVVSGSGKEYLIPAIADVIHTVDLSNGRMLITPLEGLLDL